MPTLVALVTAVGMLRASGALEWLSQILTPVATLLKLPPQVIPLVLMRPISGSSALVLFRDLLANFGPESTVGRVASVIMGSTETTFYTLAVYFGAVGIRDTGCALPASLAANLVGFVASAWAVHLFLG